MFRFRDTGKLINLQELKEAFPNTSFPQTIISDSIDHLDMDVVLEGVIPQITEVEEYYIDGAVQLNGLWYTNYVVKPLFDNKVDEDAYIKQRQKYQIRADIAALEASVTPRRQREAILGADNGWLANVDLEIAELRGQL
jgi:hypothetical protein